jgi:hypothetical protein
MAVFGSILLTGDMVAKYSIFINASSDTKALFVFVTLRS